MKKAFLFIAALAITMTTLCAFDLKENTKSNIQYWNTNYGINGANVKTREHGIIWPRNSDNEYQMGAGIIFGAKIIDNEGEEQTRTIGYHTTDATSDFVPGSNEIDPTVEVVPNSEKKYPLYLSSDYDKNGNPIDGNAPIWPLWNSTNHKFGDYIVNADSRSDLYYPKGPKFLGDETMVCIYKDTDYRYQRNHNEHPIPYFNVQIEEKTVFWDTEPLNDLVLVIYTITNMSDQVLKDASFGKLFDFDISKKKQYYKDRVRQHSNKNKRMFYCWTDLDEGPKDYMAISMIISPQLNSERYPVATDNIDNYNSGLDIATALNFDIAHELDKNISYEQMTSNAKFVPSTEDDQRLMIASETFNLAPGQSVSFGVAQIFGKANLNGQIVEASGNENELREIEEKWQALYDKIYIEGFKIQSSSVSAIDEKSTNFYPNPTNGQINFNENFAEGTSIEIYDVFGNKQLSTQGKVGNIDLSNFESGTYYIRITNKNKTTYDKVILQK